MTDNKVVPLRQRPIASGYPIIRKIIDGKIVEYVDVDSLTPEQRARWMKEHNRQ